MINPVQVHLCKPTLNGGHNQHTALTNMGHFFGSLFVSETWVCYIQLLAKKRWKKFPTPMRTVHWLCPPFKCGHDFSPHHSISTCWPTNTNTTQQLYLKLESAKKHDIKRLKSQKASLTSKCPVSIISLRRQMLVSLFFSSSSMVQLLRACTHGPSYICANLHKH